MNKAEKSLRWVVNQIPDFTPKNNGDKMLDGIKLYSEAGAEEIKRLKAENAALRNRLEKAVELPVKIGDRVFCIVGLEPAVEEFEVVAIKLQRSNLPYILFEFQGIDVGYKTAGWLSEYGKKWFTELEAAEARLKERQGEEK